MNSNKEFGLILARIIRAPPNSLEVRPLALQVALDSANLQPTTTLQSPEVEVELDSQDIEEEQTTR
jgi:hypothetical protein